MAAMNATIRLLTWICAVASVASVSPGTRSAVLGRRLSGLGAETDTDIIGQQTRWILTQRGGATDRSDDEESDNEYGSDEEIDDDDDDDDMFDDEGEEDDGLFDDFEDDVDENDFAESNLVDQLIKAYRVTPPLTKMYLTASAIATVGAKAVNKNEFPKILLLDWKQVLKRGQLWRPFTTFLNFGGFGLGYVLSMNFVWTYLASLERLYHHKPYEFWIAFLFGMVSMVVGYPALRLNPRFLGHNLSTYFTYIWSKHHEGFPVNVFGLVNVQAESLPWIFVFQTFLLEGELPVLDVLGIAFGHVYYHLHSNGVIRPPQFLISWYKSSTMAKPIRNRYKQISSDFEFVQD